MKKRFLALAFSLMMAVSCFTGCNDKTSDTKVVTSKDGGVPEVTLEPGESFQADLGGTFNYEKKNMDIEFIEIGQTSDTLTNDGCYCYAFIFKATNNSKEQTKIWMFDDFTVSIDGTEIGHDMYSAISAANAAMAYPDYQRYNATLEPGDSIMGFVPFQVPAGWNNMTIKYKPDSDHSNDIIVYDISSAEVMRKY